MNLRHDELYGRARVVLNQNIKRLWFKVNPYLEKNDKLEIQPESPSKFIEPLQSTVVSEGLSKDEYSHEHRDISIGAFWDFLYSSRWEEGCSVRVMEGQLLDHLMSTIHVLVTEGEVVHHRTHAFARNQRERRGCYKLANQQGCASIQETLLLEFTYYGQKVIPSRSHQSDISTYPDSLTTSATFSSPVTGVFTNCNSYSRAKKFTKTRKKTPINAGQSSRLNTADTEASPQRRSTTELTVEEEERDSFDPANHDNGPFTAFDPSMSNRIEVVPMNLSIQTNASSESDYRGRSEIPSLYRLQCTERVKDGESYLDQLPPNVQIDSFGEEMYLSESNDHEVISESVVSKLRKRRKEKINEREEYKQFLKEFESKTTAPYVPSDNFKDSPSFHLQYKFLDKVPTFEEFIALLEEEQKYDPRFKRARQITRKLAKRYNMTKDNIIGRNNSMVPQQSFAASHHKGGSRQSSLVIKLPPIGDASQKKPKKSIDMGRGPNAKLFGTSTSKRGTPLEKIISATNLDDVPVPSAKPKTPVQIAKEVGAVTDSEPCEKHVLDHMSKQNKDATSARKKSMTPTGPKKKKTRVKTPAIIPMILLSTPNGVSYVIHEAPTQKNNMRRKSSVGGRRSSRSMGSAHSRASSRGILDESPPQEQESSEEDEEINPIGNMFDSSKLNMRYSFERLRGKNYHKKKPAFFSVLKKFYRAQKAIDAFTAPTSDDMAKKRIRRKSVFHRLMNPDKSENIDDKEAVGKLKQYNFLLHRRRRTRVRVEDPDLFEAISMADFKDYVMQALKDFVVRREHVVSDYGGKSCTTITFTKKSVFDGIHFAEIGKEF